MRSQGQSDCPGNSIGNFTQKASMNMSSQLNPVIPRTTLVSADPGKLPHEVGADLGGTLEFWNNSDEFPEFEIEFEKPGPPCATDTLTGTKHKPIIVHMPDTDSVFYYHIVYKRKDGTCRREVNRLAKSCPGCGR